MPMPGMRKRGSSWSWEMGLVWSVARHYSGRGHELEDLFQIGCIGLLKAVDKFDLNFQVRFSTYAVPMIAGKSGVSCRTTE